MTIKELQGFLGLVNFYRRFLPGVAAKLLPLTDVLKGNRPALELLTWTQEMETSFMAAKAALSKTTCLGHPYSTARHIGAALHQQLKGHST
jgi:glycerol-3-phosphate acyltransferase PlsY